MYYYEPNVTHSVSYTAHHPDITPVNIDSVLIILMFACCCILNCFATGPNTSRRVSRRNIEHTVNNDYNVNNSDNNYDNNYDNYSDIVLEVPEPAVAVGDINETEISNSLSGMVKQTIEDAPPNYENVIH